MSAATPVPIVRANTAPPPIRTRVVLTAIAIVAAAGALRIWNIDAGIPHSLNQDEPQIMLRVVQMMRTGDFNPHFFQWPTLTFYLNLIVSCLTFLAGAMAGHWKHLDFLPMDALYLSGRYFTAMLGTATVAVVFAIGRRWGVGVALAAPALLAVLPIHVRESHYVLTDVPTAFFTTLTILLSLRAHEQQTRRRLIWAGVTAGLAASCKYNGAIAIVMPLVVVWTYGWTSGWAGWNARVARTLIVLAAALAGFLAGTPYAVLDLPAFLNEYAGLAFTFARERPGEAGWSIYAKHLLGTLSWPGVLLAAAGVLMTAARVLTGPARIPSLAIFAFSVLYFVVMAGSYQIFGRYLVPLLPAVAVMAAIAAAGAAAVLQRLLTHRLKSRMTGTLAGAAVMSLMLAPPAVASWGFGRELGRPNTIDQAHQWIVTHVPAGSTVVVEAGALRLSDRYRLVVSTRLIDRSFEDYAKDGVTYILAASPQFQATLRDPGASPEMTAAFRALLGRMTEEAAFDPSPSLSGPSMRIYRMPR